MSQEFKKILVTDRAGVGDAILATPVLRALKEKYPKSQLTFLAGRNVYRLFQGLPFVDSVVAYEKGQSSMLETIRKIWRYDLAICLDFKYRSAVIAFLAAIPVRAGLRHKRGLFLTRPVERDLHEEAIYEPYNYAGIIERSLHIPLGDDLTRLEVGPATPEITAKVDKLLNDFQLTSQERLVAVAPFTSTYEKNWPVEKWQELIVALQKKYACKVLLLGTPEKEATVAALKPGIPWFGLTDLAEMAEVMRRCRLFIGSCSGPLHIASAVGLPVVALYGPTSAAHWAPRHNVKILEHNFPCRPCYMTGVVCDKDRLCMSSISVVEVLTACDELWTPEGRSI